MAFFCLASALALGAALVARLRLSLYPFEATAMAVVLGLYGWTWLGFTTSLVLPFDVSLPLTVVVATALAIGVWFREPTRPERWRPLEGGRRAWVVWGVTTAVTGAILTRLFWTHSLTSDATGVYSAGSTWADFGLHAAIVSHVSAFDDLRMDLPVASGEHMTYPFLIDFLSAVLVKGGWGLHASLFLPGVLLALACCQLLISFSLRLFRSIGAATVGTLLVLLTGSAAGTWLFWSDFRDSGASLASFLGKLPVDYTTRPEDNATVANFVVHAMLPQRAILFGLGVGLTVLVLVHAHREAGRRLHLAAAAVLVGLLPMAHPHTFIVCMAVLGVIAVAVAAETRRAPWAHLAAIGGALVLAAPQLAWQQFANGHGTGGRFHFGWMVRPDESVWSFWWTNFGLMGPVFLLLPFVLWRRSELRPYLLWYVPFAGILVLTQVYVFQPFEFDNLKLIYYVYLMTGLILGHLAVVAWRQSFAARVALVPLALVVALPGTLSVVHEFQLRDQFANPDDVALAAWVRDATPAGSVFLTTDRPNNPISALGGRPVVLGYTGWLYNFSIPYADRSAAVRAALAGNTQDPIVRRYDPDYLAVQSAESASWPVDRAALAALPAVFANSSWTVYRLPDRETTVAPDA